MSRPALPYLTATALRAILPDGRPLLELPHLALADERLGLIGANGSGKSTLLRILAGDLTPAGGTVRARGRLGWLRQTRQAPAQQTVAQALGIADDWHDLGRATRALSALGLASLAFDRPLATLSGGESTRLAIAAQVMLDPDALLLDEPTNDLDAEGRRAICRFVRGWRRGLIVATHDRDLLAEVDRIVLLERGRARIYGSAWEAYVAQRRVEQEALERELANARAEQERALRHAREVQERQARRAAAGKRSRDTGSQPKFVLNARRERAEGTSARLRDAVTKIRETAAARADAAHEALRARDALTMALPASGLPAGRIVLALEEATIGPTPDHPLLHGVTLTIRGPMRVAVRGPNGSGKSTLMRVLAGELAPLAGQLRPAPTGIRVAYLDQSLRLLDGASTVRDAYARQHPVAPTEDLHAALARFRFRADASHQPLHRLSGGERLRAALVCVLGGPSVPQLLLLDEPTNHLDLEHLEALEAALRGYDGALVLVSHDDRFLHGVGIDQHLDLTRRDRGGRLRL